MFNVANSKSHNLLVEWIVQSALAKKGKQYLRGRMIDIGCGTKPYKPLLKDLVSEHVGVDHEATFHDQSNIDLYGTAYAIPAEDGSFDSALCTAVLEHLEEPEMAIRECYRVLKPGGIAIYCVPFIWHLHEEPRDFYRYSKYGLRYLFEKANFEIVEMNALSGFWVTFGQLFVYKLMIFNRGPFRWFKIYDGVALLIQAIAFGLDRIDRAEQWTWMYMVVARKPAKI